MTPSQQQLLRQQRHHERTYENLLGRILDETQSPTADDTSTMAPSSGDDGTSGEDTTTNAAGSNDASKGFGWFSMTIFLLVLAFVFWRLWVRYQHRQEQRLMDYRSAQADKVLGDMQMVPQHDDFDNELL